MIEFKNSWSKKELKVYVLLFCNNANYFDATQIKSNFKNNEFKDIYSEFNKDNDYQGIQKMCWVVKNNEYSKEQLKALFLDIKGLFSLSKKRNNFIANNIFTNLERIIIEAA